MNLASKTVAELFACVDQNVTGGCYAGDLGILESLRELARRAEANDALRVAAKRIRLRRTGVVSHWVGVPDEELSALADALNVVPATPASKPVAELDEEWRKCKNAMLTTGMDLCADRLRAAILCIARRVGMEAP